MAKTVKMTALMDFPYADKSIKTGEDFAAFSETDAVALEQYGRAERKKNINTQSPPNLRTRRMSQQTSENSNENYNSSDMRAE